jgi:hypothetical protein
MLIAEEESPESIAVLVRQLLSDKSMCARLPKAAVLHFWENYIPADIARETVTYYEETVDL